MRARLFRSREAALGCAALWFILPAAAQLPVPSGCTLPASLDGTLDARHARPGAHLRAHLVQRVPLPGGAFLPAKATLTGTVIAASPQGLTLRFDTLTVRGRSTPIRVKLLAAADWLDVERTYENLGSADRGAGNPAQWTTEQIGGDEVYRANTIAKVYNRTSELVGRADGTGVYGAPLKPGGPERAMGPFSTTSSGLYDLPGLRLGPQQANAITLGITDPKWKVHTHAGLLFEVAP